MGLPVHEVARGAVPPVDRFPVRKERAQLVEDVVNAVSVNEAVGVVEPTYGWGDVAAGVVWVLVGAGGFDGA